MYGLMAQFDNRYDLLAAAKGAYAAGYREMDAYTPFPVHGLADAIGKADNWVQRMVLAGGLAGCAGGFALMYWITNIAYPMNVGGKPDFSWPAYVPITFETTVLLASLTAVFGMLGINGLPQPYHPVFNAPGFDRASQDRFFLCIETADPKFNADETRKFLESFHPQEVVEVES
jgi:hypothetical protein